MGKAVLKMSAKLLYMDWHPDIEVLHAELRNNILRFTLSSERFQKPRVLLTDVVRPVPKRKDFSQYNT